MLLRFVVARLLWGFVLFLAITLFTFVVFFVIPQPHVRLQGRGQNADEADIRNSFRLHGSVVHQYTTFVYRFVRHGDLGRSYFNRQKVMNIITRAAPVTLSLLLGGAVMFILIAFPIGILSAIRPRSLLDRLGMVFVLIGVSAHPAWLGLILGHFLGYRWHLLPFTGYCEMITPTTVCGGPTQWTYHLILPWFTFALLYSAIYARMIRASVLETLDEEYVRTARAKGASEFRVVRSHVLRNALLPIVTMLGMDLGTALGGVVFIETVFGLPGLGGMLRGAIPSHDLPVICGVVMFTTTGILLFNLVVDLTYSFIDPRVLAREAPMPAVVRARGGPASRPATAPAAPSA
jgi:peptide/nickel transport system permease protein